MPTLTDLRIDRAKLPASGQAFIWCSRDRGFGVRLNAAGTRTFVVQGRVGGRERRVSIGHRSTLTVDQARDRARVDSEALQGAANRLDAFGGYAAATPEGPTA